MNIESIIRALDDGTRLRIMRLLADLELSVGELCSILGQSQPRVSRHIGILCDAGMAERRREGSSTYLRATFSERSAGRLEAAVASLLNAAEACDAKFAERCADDRRHLDAIRANRELAAEQYFAEHTDSWCQMREMFGPPGKVEEAMVDALQGRAPGRVLDIGTGTGRIAELLAEQADHVVALDRSPEMLRLARARLQKFPLQQLEILQGDFGALPFREESFDTVIFHHVLRYASDASGPLAEAARVCKVGGMLLIADCSNHQHRELLRERGHARLGFADDEMEQMLRDSGFDPAEPVSVPGQAVTTKIWAATRMPDRMRGRGPLSVTASKH